MSPLISVPKDTIERPAFSMPPEGSYAAAVRPNITIEQKSWGRGVLVPVGDFTTREGEESFTDERNGNRVNLRGFERRLFLSAEHTNVKTVQIALEQIAKLAAALGITVDDGAGNVVVPGETLDEVIVNLNHAAANGAPRVGVSIVHEQRRDRTTKQPLTKPDGEPVIDANIKSIWPLTSTT